MKKVSKRDLRTMLICSFRYALGRKTYITHDVSELIKEHYKALSARDIDQIISDIDHAIEHDIVGMDCDKGNWLELKNFLKGDL